MNDSDFTAPVHKNNVASDMLLESPDTAEIRGQLREPPQGFQVTLSKEVSSELTERLQKQGESIEASTAEDPNWLTLVIIFSAFIAILGLWFYRMKRARGGPMQSPPTPPTAPPTPTSRPIQ
jgi:ATP-dependent Zn protease